VSVDTKQETALVAVDWGTSSLRGARIAADGTVLEEKSAPRGILSVPAGGFPSAFQDEFGGWLAPGGLCLISGMAGSRQGWVEAPYCPCPAGFAELGAKLAWLDVPSQDGASPRVAIVPGLCCNQDTTPDVMRGEEVQIFGAMRLTGINTGSFVLPGTHSKWATVEHGRVTGFRTYMTGEFYALLSQHSILARTLKADAPFDETAFAQGVQRAREPGGLLHHAFSARTLSLFEKMEPGPLASYLSGLVIGEELRTRHLETDIEVVLIGSPALTQRYAQALALHGAGSRSLGSEATWAGLHALAGSLAQGAS